MASVCFSLFLCDQFLLLCYASGATSALRLQKKIDSSILAAQVEHNKDAGPEVEILGWVGQDSCTVV